MYSSLRLCSAFCLLTLSACSLPTSKSASSKGIVTLIEQAVESDLKSSGEKLAYASTIEALVANWQSQTERPTLNPNFTCQADQATWNVKVAWPQSLQFDELIPVVPQKDRQLTRQVLREGVGTPFVAVWKQTPERKKSHPFLSEGGYMMPVTVTLEREAMKAGVRQAVLRVHDPREEATVTINQRRHPLAADWSAVSEQILISAKEQKVMPGLAAMRNSQKYLDKLGIISLEPPARGRIPVIFVHGLMSRPLTWHNAFNELGADPEIQKKYQMFFFRYPSGVPVIYSSAKFRQQLSLLQQEFHRVGNHSAERNMVLIGHSMGGLVSKLQVQSSGDRLWVNLFGAKPADLGLSKEEYDNFKQYLEFNPNPNISRVLFVCTPHRGSKLA